MYVYSSCRMFHSGKNVHTWETQLPSLTKLARVIFFHLARRAALPARCSIRICLFSGLQCAETFHLAFPERPQEKVDMLASRMANKDGKICEYGHYTHMLF